MWDISTETAHKACELIFLVAPVLALTYLFESRVTDASNEVRDDTAEGAAVPGSQQVQHEVNEAWHTYAFYSGFVLSLLLAILGILIDPPGWYLALLFTVFGLTARLMFRNIGRSVVTAFWESYEASGGTFGLNWRTGMINYPLSKLFHHSRKLSHEDVLARSRRHAAYGILLVGVLTTVFIGFIIALDAALVFFSNR